jgi:molybdopterin-guanine dinucleotide biosynthesis protein A
VETIPLLDRTAIVLAGGFSRRLGKDKGLLSLGNKPLIEHVLNSTKGIADEKLVVVSSRTQKDEYSKVIGEIAEIVVDTIDAHGPLAGALTGLRKASGEYTLLLACDAPFASKDILSLLSELCINRNAAIPRWPNCCIEPLQAVYRTRPASEAAQEAMSEGGSNMQAMVAKLKSVRYVSTLVLEQLDPGLKTFFNINTKADLKKAEHMLEHHERGIL